MRLFCLDREGAARRVKAAARRLKAALPEVEEVYLFGSLARGDAVPGSDADLLVILSVSVLPPAERAARIKAMMADPGLPLDLTVYTREEFERLRSEGNLFLAKLLGEAVRLV